MAARRSTRKKKRATHRIHFKPGDHLAIRAHKQFGKDRGLSYPAMTVVARDEGAGGQYGGWDVYDGVTSDGDEVSFYGFSVDSKGRKRRKGDA